LEANAAFFVTPNFWGALEVDCTMVDVDLAEADVFLVLDADFDVDDDGDLTVDAVDVLVMEDDMVVKELMADDDCTVETGAEEETEVEVT
jgi:hypothetical protein